MWTTHTKRSLGVKHGILKYNFCTMRTIAHRQLILAHIFIILLGSLFPARDNLVHPAGKREPSNEMADKIKTIVTSGLNNRNL